MSTEAEVMARVRDPGRVQDRLSQWADPGAATTTRPDVVTYKSATVDADSGKGEWETSAADADTMRAGDLDAALDSVRHLLRELDSDEADETRNTYTGALPSARQQRG